MGGWVTASSDKWWGALEAPRTARALLKSDPEHHTRVVRGDGRVCTGPGIGLEAPCEAVGAHGGPGSSDGSLEFVGPRTALVGGSECVGTAEVDAADGDAAASTGKQTGDQESENHRNPEVGKLETNESGDRESENERKV